MKRSELKNWTNKELEKELEDYRWQIAQGSFGRFDLTMEQWICTELDRREKS